MRRLGNEHGISIVEMLVAVLIALVLGAAAISVVRSQSLSMRTQAAQLELNDSARRVVELMTREIRVAGFNPQCIAGAFPAIVTGEPQRLRIQFDLQPYGQFNAASDEVTYQYDLGTNSLQRVVSGQASVLIDNLPAAGFQFRYFQGNGMELVPSGSLSDSQRAEVRRVSIRLESERTVDTRMESEAHSVLWTNVDLRNRGYECES